MTRPLAARLTFDERAALQRVMAADPHPWCFPRRLKPAVEALIERGLIRRSGLGLVVAWENIPRAPCTDMAWSEVERRMGLAP